MTRRELIEIGEYLNKHYPMRRTRNLNAPRWALVACLLLGLLSGCASYSPYEQVKGFATMEECRIAHRLGKIDDRALFQCDVERLPETLF